MNAQEAITQYVEGANGVRYAYRLIGVGSEVPLLIWNHFRGNMDWWDPLLVNTIAAKRQVILFDSQGVGRSSGKVPDTFKGWAQDTKAFLEALGLKKIDLLGLSMGARASQMVALTLPHMVRRLILAGASPAMWLPDSPADVRNPKYLQGMANAKTYEEAKDAYRLAMFGESELGRKQFNDYWGRLEQRKVETPILEPLALEKGGNNQIKAIMNADHPDKVSMPDRLKELKMPILVANGQNDLVLATARTMHLFNRLDNAQLVIYPRSGHGFLWQYAELFGTEVNAFLDSPTFDENKA